VMNTADQEIDFIFDLSGWGGGGNVTNFVQCTVGWRVGYWTRRLCTDRSWEAAVIFLFDMEALFTWNSRAHSFAVLSLPPMLGCYWLLQRSNWFLILFSLPCGLGEKCFLLGCRHLHSLHWLPMLWLCGGGVLHEKLLSFQADNPLIIIIRQDTENFFIYPFSWPTLGYNHRAFRGNDSTQQALSLRGIRGKKDGEEFGQCWCWPYHGRLYPFTSVENQ
jgi:hypothetical protein